MKGQPLKIGDALPPFLHLQGVDGKNHSSEDFHSDILIIVFSCNHCPYVQAYEDRMNALQGDYRSRGVTLVAINSNDEQNYPDDSFANMVERAKQKGFDFPYLRDADQTVADSFGATHTPQFFVFDRDRRLRYAGKMDDNWKEPHLVRESYLQNAIESLLSGKEVKTQETYSIGCTIKWR
jgi:peroxiredoxin